VAEGGNAEKSTAVTAPAADGNSGHDASDADDATLAYAAAEAGASAWGPPDASCPRSGAFACRSGGRPDAAVVGTCDRATQYCSGTGVTPCQPLSQLAYESSFVDSGSCGSCPTCACIPPYNRPWGCSCFEDNFGGLTVTCSQSGCYGSPPARLRHAPKSAHLTLA
jgi:hypothetical protein